jgi:hypothetical protein
MIRYTATIPSGAAPISHKAEIIDLKELVRTLLERIELLENQVQELQILEKENSNALYKIQQKL